MTVFYLRFCCASNCMMAKRNRCDVWSGVHRYLEQEEGWAFLRICGCKEAEIPYYWEDICRSADDNGADPGRALVVAGALQDKGIAAFRVS